MERDIKKIISEMTLEEKAGMCSGMGQGIHISPELFFCLSHRIGQ